LHFSRLYKRVYTVNFIVDNGNNLEIANDKLRVGYPEFSEILNRLGILSDWYPAVDAKIEQVTHYDGLQVYDPMC